MRRWIALVLLGGCAQIFGIEQTTGQGPSPDAAVDAPAIDALPCTGGDAQVVDPGFGHCYTFFKTPAAYAAARTACQGEGAHLVHIETVTEDNLVEGLIGTNNALIGANDLGAEGTFVWDDGSLLTYVHWDTGEPNNGGGMYEEDCVVKLGASNGAWSDRPCSMPPVMSVPGEYAYVCERD